MVISIYSLRTNSVSDNFLGMNTFDFQIEALNLMLIFFVIETKAWGITLILACELSNNSISRALKG